MSDEIRHRAADLLEQSTSRPPPRAVVGFDGFLDTIAHAVDRRRSMRPDDYEPVRTIAALGRRIGDAAGRSANLELRAREVRAGGNGPIMAGALASLGVEVTLIGALGREGAPADIDPAYRPLAERCVRVVSVASSARTDALEFEDGKIMLNWSANLDGLDWDAVVRAIPPAELAELCAGAALLATVNWTNLGGLPSIWRGLREQVLPRTGGRSLGLFVDLTDPAKRTDDELRRALDDLSLFPNHISVTLGLNIAEAERFRALLGLGASPIRRTPEGMAAAASEIRDATGLDEIVLHTRGAAGAATRAESVGLPTRLVERPAISTGAGDHFNGGYSAARALGLPLGESLACGCDTASAFVRTGRCPSRSELVNELRASLGTG
jgi:sugar/nucleoside kinase (ribokinase family)